MEDRAPLAHILFVLCSAIFLYFLSICFACRLSREMKNAWKEWYDCSSIYVEVVEILYKKQRRA